MSGHNWIVVTTIFMVTFVAAPDKAFPLRISVFNFPVCLLAV